MQLKTPCCEQGMTCPEPSTGDRSDEEQAKRQELRTSMNDTRRRDRWELENIRLRDEECSAFELRPSEKRQKSVNLERQHHPPA